ncbi:MAG: hypothetical protein E6Q61_10050 [Nitrosomonas sp.]|nr:MAG: hypothetical protein E6Q61_10050 [Nitrosomonas sp.]HMU64524.1 hypothetical protein [Nitrosomonas sp.]
MTNNKPMTRPELIRLIGDVLTEVDVLRSNFDRETEERKNLDNIRDALDTYQRKIVRNVINDNTAKFKEHATSLKKINEDLRQTIEDINKIAKTLETLVEFVKVVQKAAELMP